jgi:hypothetical protein
LELGDDRASPRSYIDADLAVSRVEPSGLINRRFFSSDKVEWKIRELSKNVVSAEEYLWLYSGKCSVYQCVICNEVVVACLKLMTLLPFILKFFDGVSNHIPAVERMKRIPSCSRRPCSNSSNGNGNKPAAS